MIDVRPECARAFQEIATNSGHVEDAIRRVEKQLAVLSRAVIGNGDYKRSLFAEVQRQGLYWKIVKVVLLALPPIAAIIFGILHWMK